MIEYPPASRYVESTFEFHRLKMELPKAISRDSELGLWMLITYRVATCDDGTRCRKGDHILESLAGRAYNLALSAVLLCSAGLYDKALNSVRSLGELANLLTYLSIYPDDYPNWVRANKKIRLSQYSPIRIRAAIEKKRHLPPPMSQDIYAQLCELSTHVHGATSPNAYSSDGRKHVGGFVQEAGADRVADILDYTMSMVALLVTKMVERDDLFSVAVAAARAVPKSR